MADLTKTVSNTMRLSGPSPTNKWGFFLWGENWGDSKDGYFTVIKYIGNAIAIASDMATASIQKLIQNSFSLSSRMNLVSLTDGSGYYYVFPSEVTDPDSRFFPTWTEASEPSTSFTTATEPTTTWTEA